MKLSRLAFPFLCYLECTHQFVAKPRFKTGNPSRIKIIQVRLHTTPSHMLRSGGVASSVMAYICFFFVVSQVAITSPIFPMKDEGQPYYVESSATLDSISNSYVIPFVQFSSVQFINFISHFTSAFKDQQPSRRPSQSSSPSTSPRIPQLRSLSLLLHPFLLQSPHS